MNPKKTFDGRLTGKQLFENDRNLALSDVFDDGEVPIDASLFEDSEE